MIRGAWTKLRAKLTTSMRQRAAAGLVLAMLMLSIPRPAQAQFGIDLALIIAGLKQINSLLTSQVAAPLQQIQKIESEYTQFQQDVIYPIGAINQLKNAVLMFRNEMKAMNGLMTMQYNSAQLPVTQQLEQLLLSGDPSMLKLIEGGISALITELGLIIGYIVLPFSLAIFMICFVFWGSILYVLGPLAIGRCCMPAFCSKNWDPDHSGPSLFQALRCLCLLEVPHRRACEPLLTPFVPRQVMALGDLRDGVPDQQ